MLFPSSRLYRYLCVPGLFMVALNLVQAEPRDDAAQDDSIPVARDDGWRLNFDNDVLSGQATDRDYTGGIGITLSGKLARDNPVTLEPARRYLFNGIHDRFAKDNAAAVQQYHSQQIGLILFTPEDITSRVPIYNDRPYASMLFISNSAFDVDAINGRAIISRLTLGMLGLELSADVQRLLHEAIGSDTPNGWSYQISAGGEPALMLDIARQDVLASSNRQQLKLESGVTLGSITDINAGFSWRVGNVHSPWWTYNPYQSRYFQQSMPVFGPVDNEWFLYAGAKGSVRIYNALLQGQFRDSEVTVASGDVETLVAEAWLGLALGFGRHYQVDFFVRGTTPEIDGPGRRNLLWGGLVFSYVE